MAQSVKVNIRILNWVTGSVIYESEKETIKEALHEANLHGANLHGADLREANLHGANLHEANLYGANLHEANLHEANLYGADLRGADLYGANLHEANLYGANLHGANLHEANLHGANLHGADLRGADLRGADLHGADLREANLKMLPETFINECSRDILFVLEHLRSEVPYLREKLVAGEVDGSAYEGDCACLLGTLGRATDKGLTKVCEVLPFYTKGLHNPGEQWFLNIRQGDTPETNNFAKHVLTLIDMVLDQDAKPQAELPSAE